MSLAPDGGTGAKVGKRGKLAKSANHPSKIFRSFKGSLRFPEFHNEYFGTIMLMKYGIVS